MNIKDTIAAINQMQADGVIERYAIGGAVARRSILNPWPRSMWISSSTSAPRLGVCWRARSRAKDKARLLQFIETAALDPARFQGILDRHGLREAWQRFEKQFLGDTP